MHGDKNHCPFERRLVIVLHLAWTQLYFTNPFKSMRRLRFNKIILLKDCFTF